MDNFTYDKQKLREHYNNDTSPSYQNGFVEAMKLLNVKVEDFEYITGYPYEYWN